MRHQGRAKLLAAGAALATAASFLPYAVSYSAELKAAAVPQVIVVRTANACFSATVLTTGFLVARDEAVVNLDAPGFRVAEILANEGDRVTSAQVLAKLTRQADGPDPGAAPANSTPGNAANNAASNTATLKAPAGGLITKSTAVVGAVASPFQPEPLFRIAVGNEIELEVEVPSVHVTELNPGQTARVEMENGRGLIGRVRLAPVEVDPRTQLGRARISLESDPTLRIGMFGRAAINANRSCGVSVPTSAIRYRTGGTSVQVVHDATVQTLSVQVGLHSDTDTEIREGLHEGDVVVANAGASLREGDRITAILGDGSRLDAH